MKIKKGASWFLSATVFSVLILLSACGGKSSKTESETGERIFPDFKFSASDGNVYTEKDLEKGVTIAGFMVSWCVPCAGELKILNEYKTEYSAKKLQVLVFTYEDYSKYDSLMNSLGLDIPVLKADSTLLAALKIDVIPTRILLNNGREIKRVVGAPSFEEDAFRKVLADLLGAKQATEDPAGK